MVASIILDLAKRRKTARRFSSTRVNLKEVLVALETACQAPSGANSQPWRFVIVADPQTRRRVKEACERGEKEFYLKVKWRLREWLLSRGFSWQKPFLEEAPLLVLVLSEARAPYSTQSVSLAMGYILLALEEFGLGTVTYTPSTTRRVLDEIGVPNGFRLEAVLPIGVSASVKSKEPRLGFKEVTYMDSWGSPYMFDGSFC